MQIKTMQQKNRYVALLFGATYFFLSTTLLGVISTGIVNTHKSWPVVGQDYDNNGTAPRLHKNVLDNITSLNVEFIEEKWSTFDFATAGVAGQPAIDDGVVYYADGSGYVYARDLETGALIWQTEQLFTDVEDEENNLIPQNFVTTPVLGSDNLFISDDHMYSIDRSTGTVNWRTLVGVPVLNQQGTVANDFSSDATLVDDLVIVGSASNENSSANTAGAIDFKARGSVVAMDQHTGNVVWRFFTTDDQEDPNHLWGAGAGVWSSPAVDRQRKLIFIGVGQSFEGDVGTEVDADEDGYPDAKGTSTNPYTDSLLAINYQTGELVWKKQFTQNDIWRTGVPEIPASLIYADGPDYDVSTHPNLFTVRIGFHRVDLVGVGDKKGHYYILKVDQASSDAEVLADLELDPATLWGAFQSTPAVSDGVLYVNTSASLDECGHRTAMHEFYEYPIDAFALYNEASTKTVAIDLEQLLNTSGSLDFTGANKITGFEHFIKWQKINDGHGQNLGPLTLYNDVLYQTTTSGLFLARDTYTGNILFQTTVFPDGLPLGPVTFDAPLASGVSIVDNRLVLGVSFFALPGGVAMYALP